MARRRAACSRAFKAGEGAYHLVALGLRRDGAPRTSSARRRPGGRAATRRGPADLARHRVRRRRLRRSGGLSRRRGAARPLRRRRSGRAAARRAPDQGGERRMRPALAYSPAPARSTTRAPPRPALYLGSFAVVAFALPIPSSSPGARRRGRRRGLCARRRAGARASARWGADCSGSSSSRSTASSPSAATRSSSTGCGCRCSGRPTSAPRRWPRAAVLALRILVVLMAFAVHSACVDPDRTAAPAAPAGAPLGADRDPDRPPGAARRRRPRPAGRGRRAPRPGRGPGGTVRHWRAASSPARSTARSTSPPPSSCVATRTGPPRRAAAAAGRAVVALRRGGPRDPRAGHRAAAGGAADFDPYPTVSIDSRHGHPGGGPGRPALAALPFARMHEVRDARRRGGGPWLSRSSGSSRFSYRYPDGSAPTPSRPRPRRSSRAS